MTSYFVISGNAVSLYAVLDYIFLADWVVPTSYLRDCVIFANWPGFIWAVIPPNIPPFIKHLLRDVQKFDLFVEHLGAFSLGNLYRIKGDSFLWFFCIPFVAFFDHKGNLSRQPQLKVHFRFHCPLGPSAWWTKVIFLMFSTGDDFKISCSEFSTTSTLSCIMQPLDTTSDLFTVSFNVPIHFIHYIVRISNICSWICLLLSNTLGMTEHSYRG